MYTYLSNHPKEDRQEYLNHNACSPRCSKEEASQFHEQYVEGSSFAASKVNWNDCDFFCTSLSIILACKKVLISELENRRMDSNLLRSRQ